MDPSDPRVSLVLGLGVQAVEVHRWRQLALWLADDPAASAEDLREVLRALAISTEVTESMIACACAMLDDPSPLADHGASG